MQIILGTDGWRGKITETFTFDNVRRAAQGFSSFLQHKGIGGKDVVIGYDQRFSSDLFAKACGAYSRKVKQIPLGPDSDARLKVLEGVVDETEATIMQVVLAWAMQN